MPAVDQAALKKLICTFCDENLAMRDIGLDDAENALIPKMSKGGLKFPLRSAVNAVLFTEIVLNKPRAPE